MNGALAWAGVAVLGALGALQRHRLTAAVAARRPGDVPLGTLTVNLSGALALGLLVGLGVSGAWLAVLGGGFLGGFTTFSTWMVEAHRLGKRGQRRLAAIYVLGSMAAGLAATGAGWLVGSALR